MESMSQAKSAFKYPLIKKKAVRFQKNITFKCETEMKELEAELLLNDVDVAESLRAACWDALLELKAQLEQKQTGED